MIKWCGREGGGRNGQGEFSGAEKMELLPALGLTAERAPHPLAHRATLGKFACFGAATPAARDSTATALKFPPERTPTPRSSGRNASREEALSPRAPLGRDVIDMRLRAKERHMGIWLEGKAAGRHGPGPGARPRGGADQGPPKGRSPDWWP